MKIADSSPEYQVRRRQLVVLKGTKLFEFERLKMSDAASPHVPESKLFEPMLPPTSITSLKQIGDIIRGLRTGPSRGYK